MRSIPTAPLFKPNQFVPPDQIQRLGPGQVLHMVHYDTPLYGRSQVLGSDTQLFSTPGRLGNDDLCSLKEAGKFSDFKQFIVYAIGVQAQFNQVADPGGNASAEELYDLLVYQSRIHIKYQDAEKQILWSDQLPAGGGVYGFTTSNSTFHLTNGVPSSSCKFFFKEPLVITPQKTFRLTMKWNSSLVGGAADPRTRFNASTADKLVRVYLHGLEIRDVSNG